MLDLDKFIIELGRLTTLVYFYDEVYGQKETIDTFASLSYKAAEIIQISLHNDIVMTLSRLIFDSDAYKGRKTQHEYLSLFNLRLKYQAYICPELEQYRNEVCKIKQTLNVKEYRDLIIAHSDKLTITGAIEHPKHNLNTAVLLDLLHKTRLFAFGIRVKVAHDNGEKTLPVTSCDVYRNGVGSTFIRNINKLKQRKDFL